MSPRAPSKDLRRELLGVAQELRTFRENMLDLLDRITDRVAALIETAGDAELLWRPPPGYTFDPQGGQSEELGKKDAWSPPSPPGSPASRVGHEDP